MSRLLPRLLVYAPMSRGEPASVVASGRAGGFGALDFGHGFDAEQVQGAAEQVARYAQHPFGLRIPADELDASRLGALPKSLRALILVASGTTDWERLLAEARRMSLLVLTEVRETSQAKKAAFSGVDGLILSGHEAGGLIAEESSLVFLQEVRRRLGDDLPVWVRGGIGPPGASACLAAGASGVVLEGACLLAREFGLTSPIREAVQRADGSESVVLGPPGDRLRLLAPPGSSVLSRLREAAKAGENAWQNAVQESVGWGLEQAWPIGQDAGFAADLARRFVTIGGIVQEVERAIDDGIRSARSLRVLAENSQLARSHGTRFPVVQGPMTRVSDSARFAESVAEGGALPMLALALMRGSDCRELLNETAQRLGDRPWGVGLLGFAPSDLRQEQIEALRRVRPPFALIAGGRTDQARSLEESGIATYLHAPSPALLRQFLRDGARRFVLEGRECGGHVGPRSSLVLWGQVVEIIQQAIENEGLDAEEVHLLFAGGVHDARSAASVAALASPLASRGVKVGVLMGTAYLFTEEAVATGAVVPGFQAEALACERTVLLETGPGHEIRVSPTPFAAQFELERQRLQAEGQPPEMIREALERLNTGRLRLAAKGVERDGGRDSPLQEVHPYDQKQRGVYMLGQVAALRDRVTTVQELHQAIAKGSGDWLDRLPIPSAEPVEVRAEPSEIAIIGMAAILPKAPDVATFWENTLKGLDAITEIPIDRWDWRLDYDPDPRSPDKVSSKWGGFVPEIPFDPLRYGMPPSSVPSIEPLQLLMLEAVQSAFEDAGYRDRPFDRERAAVVLGAGGGAAQLAMGYAVRSYLPLIERVSGTDLSACREVLPEWTEDSFPGILLNVAAGRVANRFNLGGANYTVDAACGSSLAAAALAVRELETGAADMVVLGGADTVQNPFTYLAFSKTHALSPRGRCRPFDAGADGIVISEGVAVLILKRRADAERDGDRIYALIQGLGASSDGRAKGLTAPHPQGQARALRRAYAKAGISPASIGYVEAHGTGTAAGDLSEVEALSRIFLESGAEPGRCALGSVKSSIGHTKCAAGLAGLINAALALYHKTLPPTMGIESPNPRIQLERSPFYLSTTAKPWFHDENQGPRRAGVSAFGFGGTNFHAVLEEYAGDPISRNEAPRTWPAELLVWRAEGREPLRSALDLVDSALSATNPPTLADLASQLAKQLQAARGSQRLAIVANSPADLQEKLQRARALFDEAVTSRHDPSGIFYDSKVPETPPRVAFLFPGQGSQRPEMLGELALAVPAVRMGFQAFDDALRARGLPAIGPRIFSPRAFDEEGERLRKDALRSPEVAQVALGAACSTLLDWLVSLGIEPNALAGHSFGELVALRASGVFSKGDLAELAEARGRWMVEASQGLEPGAMVALLGGSGAVEPLLEGIEGAWPVNWNGPRQTVISGTAIAIEAVIERAQSAGLASRRIAVGGAFHTPAMEMVGSRLSALAVERFQGAPSCPIYSNRTAGVYPADPREIADELGRHVSSPVQFGEMIEAMHEDGLRVFVEVGPGSTLTGLIGSILADRPHQAIALESAGPNALALTWQGLGRLFVAGLPIQLNRLHEGRPSRRLDPKTFLPLEGIEGPTATTWMVNGARSRPIGSPPPPCLGASGGEDLDAVAERTAARTDDATPNSRAEIHRFDAPATPDPRPLAASAREGSARVMVSFQETMRSFLQAQRATVLDYLGGRGSAGTPSPGIPEEAPGLTGKRARIDPVQMVEPPPSEAIQRDPAVPPAEAPAQDPGDPIATLLAIVAERTGYPTEMLDLDLDLEADLGIDSIKRVEILGSLREAWPSFGDGSGSTWMDDLAQARTLRAIVERLSQLAAASEVEVRARSESEAVGSIVAEEDPLPEGEEENSKPLSPGKRVAANRPGEGPDVPLPNIRRMTLAIEPAKLTNNRSTLAKGGLLIVTDDGRGVAGKVATDLRALGHPVVRVRHGSSEGEVEGVDLNSEADVKALIDRLRDRGSLAGVVHLLPLRDQGSIGLDPVVWESGTGPEVRGLFLLAKASAAELERASERGGACLIAATRLGGAFGSAGAALENFPAGQGGLAGLVKTLAHEWPAVRSRVVDLEPSGEVEVVAAEVVREIFAKDARAEVGYRSGRRQALRAIASPLPELRESDPTAWFPKGAPLILTGGARGITAAVARELARLWQPTLLLIGSGPLPSPEEGPETSGIQDEPLLKAALLESLRNERGEAISPTELERAYRAVRRDREIRATWRDCRALGAEVHYAQADVRDPEALQRVLAEWREEFGPPVGLIHGAGVIRDKLLTDKTPAAFDQVWGTKLVGALNLAREIDASRLRFAVFFSSVAGRFGNRGQSDYAAANEALNKLALWLDRHWAARVVSIAWGPWSEIGMVSNLEGHLSRRGLGLVPPSVGTSRLIEELIHGRKGEVEVIVSGDLGPLGGPSWAREDQA